MSVLPGDATAVAGTATSVERAAAAVEAARMLVHRERGAMDWTGAAADACDARLGAVEGGADAVTQSMTAIAQALSRYAADLAVAQSDAQNADDDRRRAKTKVDASPLDLPAWLDYLRARSRVWSAVQGAEAAAGRAAAAVRAALGTGAEAIAGLTDAARRDTAVPDDILDSGSMSQQDVQQQGIGSCYLLSSLMGYLRTDAGDALLRKNVRWDEQEQGYWVTLYVDGKPKQVFVDGVYDGGVRQPASVVGVASVYEAAVGIQLGYADLNDGGYSKDAMQLITGKAGEEYTTSHSWWPFDDEFGEERDDIADRLARGASVTADTGGRPNVDDLAVQVERGGSRVDTTVDVVGRHAYMVERIDDDGGVWVRNPWGQGNGADGGQVFRLAPDEFQRVFGRVTVSEVP
ncbi:C2 family cysteine protease [Cellulomonas soli]|uniref:Calpain catalytic domain-containing protein n=1 Tax=Cellulomonas soli TaxID=931535 RepID=A0A512P947_9CELL|nr:C2 family cysteine protease [Cellulomonas soli]NYI57950.1 hypothetical protein [Cellulomonas soli]GEP67733.1 hypothetical protein CSO01_04480 [Cellulomonas soli]